MGAASTNPRQLLADQHVDDPPAAEHGAHRHPPRLARVHAPDDRGALRRADGRASPRARPRASSGGATTTILPSLAR